MKTNLLVSVILIMMVTPSMSQSATRGFSRIKINYNLSFISQDPFTTKTGFGIVTDYSLSNKVFVEAGIIIKPTKKEILDYDSPGFLPFPKTHTHSEMTALYIDMPVHLNYNIINLEIFSFSLSAGPRLFYLNTSHDLSRTYDNMDPIYYKLNRNNLNLGIDLGFVENFNISSRIGIFASQHYGQAFLGFSDGFESTDLNIGIAYNLNRKQ